MLNKIQTLLSLTLKRRAVGVVIEKAESAISATWRNADVLNAIFILLTHLIDVN
jgi:hypothetical protein